MTVRKSINPEKIAFAPGCALILYNPDLSVKVQSFLDGQFGLTDTLLSCCKHDPGFQVSTKIVNVCPGCDKRFRNDYDGITTISLWEVVAESDHFNFPDYHGKSMTILDACPTRDQERVHNAIRTIIKRMNINLVEPANTMARGTCCGDSFYGVLPTVKVKELMLKRSSEMPLDDVVVYCISCIKSVSIGGKKPRYLVDLLFGEETQPGITDPDEWHKELSEYIELH